MVAKQNDSLFVFQCLLEPVPRVMSVSQILGDETLDDWETMRTSYAGANSL